jgi:outer membrane protein assembly factor BamB
MLKRLVRGFLLVIVALPLAGAVAYWGFGVRVQLDGSGMPRLRHVPTPGRTAARIESHRAAQRVEAAQPRPSAAREDPPRPRAAREDEPRRSANREGGPYWTGFRGPARDGRYQERPILTSWPAEGLTPIWRQPIGGGYASFAIARGRAFTIEQRRAQEVVAAYDVDTGRELWTDAWDGEFREWMGGDGPRATPTWFDGRVYALGALGELRSLDEADGRVLWRQNILDDNAAHNLPWGMAASPLVFDDLVVVVPGGPAQRAVVAYDRLTGGRRWAALSDKAAYSSPVLVTLAGRRQILVVLATRIVGLVPESGELLWTYPWPTMQDINASQPVVIGDSGVLLSSGYGHGAALIEVTQQNGNFGARLVWESTRLKNRFSSSVVHDGFIYGLDETILTCLDARTGEVKWKAGRYGHGQFVLASGHLVMLSEDGDLVLVRATPERHDEVARMHVLDGKTWNHPALDGGRLLVRNLAEMAAFDLRVP